jgi:hypothetical protein
VTLSVERPLRRAVVEKPVKSILWNQRVLWLAVAVSASACVGELEPAAESAEGQLGVNLGALATCGGAAADPLTQIKTLKLVVREAVGNTMVNKQSVPAVATFKPGQPSVSFTQIPAGSPREVSVIGFGADGKTPKWFGRRTGINIKKNDTTSLDMALMAVEAFTCVGAPSMPNALFPAATLIDNGRVLITGGYTATSTDGTVVRLEAPTDAAYIFDGNTGSFTKVKALMNEARAGHSMIYLPKLNKVLIVGGAKKMQVAASGLEPPKWSASDGCSLTYEIFDVGTQTFAAGADNGDNARKRVFANLIALTDDYVVSAGGAPWPLASSDDYAKSDLFNSATGKFVNVGNALQLNTVRGGAAVAYLGPTTSGTSRYLVWGGAMPGQTFGQGPADQLQHGEVFVESTEPGTAAIYGDYLFDDGAKTYDTATSLFFPSLNLVSKTKDAKGTEAFTFLLLGGVRYDPIAKAWKTPSADDAYLLTVKEPNEALKTKRIITPKRVTGLTKGVFLHQTNASGLSHLVISGGFSGFGTAAEAAIQAFHIPSGKLLGATETPASAQFVRRGGHAGLTLRNDCVLMFGGTGQLADQALNSTQQATSDVYCPKFLVP